jgi:DNA-binding NarL/FixJ family response regulator
MKQGARDETAATAAAAGRGATAAARKRRVLVADDHALVRIGVRGALLASERYELCGEAVDGLDCLAKVEALQPDLLLLDILMPRLSGLDAVARVRQVSPGTRILFLSSQESRPAVLNALQSQADGFLSKDVALSELQEAMDAACDGRRYLSPRIADLLAQAQAAGPPPALTDRQLEVLRGVARGLSNKQIARELDVSPKTVEFHRAQLMNRLGLHDVASLTRYALEAGLLA